MLNKIISAAKCRNRMKVCVLRQVLAKLPKFKAFLILPPPRCRRAAIEHKYFHVNNYILRAHKQQMHLRCSTFREQELSVVVKCRVRLCVCGGGKSS